VQHSTQPTQPGYIEPPTVFLPLGGRRKGDAILVAFNHAFNRGDVEVASQLLLEYQNLNANSLLLLNVERRKDPASLIRRLWALLRAPFVH
jgi:hypothetical protein